MKCNSTKIILWTFLSTSEEMLLNCYNQAQCKLYEVSLHCFLHWFIYQLSLNFTTWNKTVTWKLHVCTISKGLPKWTWQSRCYNFWWEIFHCAIVISMVQRVLVIIKCTCAAAHTLLLCSFWSLNWCKLQPLLINYMG